MNLALALGAVGAVVAFGAYITVAGAADPPAAASINSAEIPSASSTAAAAPPGAQITIEQVDVPPQTFIFVSGSSGATPAAAAAARNQAFTRLNGLIRLRKLRIEGAPFAITRDWDPPRHQYAFDAGIPVTPSAEELPPGFAVGHRVTGPALKVRYRGPAADAAQAYTRLDAYLSATQLKAAAPGWEVYPDAGDTAASATLDMEIYQPVM